MSSPRPAKAPLPDYRTAVDRALASIQPLDGIERVPLACAAGRVLAEAIAADRDYPPFHRATMDGYALRSADVGRVESFRVVGMVAAGSPEQPHIAPGEAVRIATGAPLPPDADAVIPHELSDRAQPVRFTASSVKPWDNVHRRSADAAAGDCLLQPGTVLGAQHLGVLATVGCTVVPVRTRPRIAILTSGDEVRPPDCPQVLDHQIRNSGQSMLAMLVKAMGGEVNTIAHLPDQPEATNHAVCAALTCCDLLITIGGISAGERDCFYAAFEASDVQPVLRGASIQPGKPIFVGRAERGQRRVCIVGLPGNPVAVLATAHLFAWPIIRVLAGLTPTLPWTGVQLAATTRANSQREAFRPSVWHRAEGTAAVLDWAGSGDLIHTTAADGLLALPISADPIPVGAMLGFLPWWWSR